MADKAARNGVDQRERNTIIVEDEVLRHGFTQIPNLLLRRNDISPGAKLTYMVLLSYAWQTDSCFPGHDRLAVDMGVARRSIVTYLQQLKDQGLIQVERRGLGQTNVYRLPRLLDPAPDRRSAKFAHQEVQKTTHQEVPNLHAKKYTEEEDSKEKDLDPSNVRKRDLTEIDGEDPEDATARKPVRVVDKASTKNAGDRTDSPRTSVASVGSILARRGAKHHAQGTLRGQKAYSDDRQQILAFIKDFATEFRDEAPLASSVSRAANLQQRSGIPLEAFCSLMYEARSLTQEYTSNIKKQRRGEAGPFGPELNKMPYFFRILEELVECHAPSKRTIAPAVERHESQQPRSGEDITKHGHVAGRHSADAVPETLPSLPRVARRPSTRYVAPSAAIVAFITDVAVESGEGEAAQEALDQVQALYSQSGLEEGSFLQVLEVVRMLAQTGRPAVVAEEDMPRFLRVLREQLELQQVV